MFNAYAVSWGDNSQPDQSGVQIVTLGTPVTADAWGAGTTLTHVYSDGPANYTIQVTLFDQTYDQQYNDAGFVGAAVQPGLALTVNNVPPTATFSNFGTVNEGSASLVKFTNQHDVSPVDQAAGFTYSYYYMSGSNQVFIGAQNTTSSTATVPASVLGHPADYTIYGEIFDKDQGETTYSTTIHVNNVAPIVNLTSTASVNQNTLFTQIGSFVDPGNVNQETWTATVDYGDGSGTQALALNPNKTFTLSHTYATATSENVTVTVTDSFGGVGVAHMTVNVQATTFQVASFNGNSSGFDVTFDRAAKLSVLNLYEGGSDSLGLPDVTVVGQHSGLPVEGSLIWDASTNTAHFVATGGLLAPDNYTVTLVSGAQAWQDTSGSLLDGLGSGVAGSGNYVNTFTVAAPTVPVLSLPDFARGPGESVNVDDAAGAVGTALTQYLPVHLSDTTGVRNVDFQINFDPSLIFITGATTAGQAAAAGWSVTTNSTIIDAHHATFTLSASGTGALPGGPSDVVDLMASIPVNAPYGASQLLKLTTVTGSNGILNEGNIGVLTAEAVQKVAFLGDATGDGALSGLDASYIARNTVGLDDGFSAYPLTDPRIIGDVTGDGTISGLDASEVANAFVGNAEPTIPMDEWGGLTSYTVSSTIDPTVGIPTLVVGNRGQAVTLPVSVTVNTGNAGLLAADLNMTYPTGNISIGNSDVTIASDLTSAGSGGEQNWGLAVNVTNGLIRTSAFSTGDPVTGTPQILNLQFHVSATAVAGVYPVHIITMPTVIGGTTIPASRLNEGQLTLSTSDGSIRVPIDVTINNAPASDPEGTPIPTLSASYVGDSNSVTYDWHVTDNIGQVVPDGTSPTFSFTPSNPGSFSVTLTIADAADPADIFGSSTVSFPVTDVTPSLSASASTNVPSVEEGGVGSQSVQ